MRRRVSLAIAALAAVVGSAIGVAQVVPEFGGSLPKHQSRSLDCPGGSFDESTISAKSGRLKCVGSGTPTSTVVAILPNTMPAAERTADPKMPTPSNTGTSGRLGTMSATSLVKTGVCRNKRISAQVRIEGPQWLGKNVTITNCALDGGLYYAAYSGSSDSDPSATKMPTLTIRHSSVLSWTQFDPMRVAADRIYVSNGGFIAPCVTCGGEDHAADQTQRRMPLTFTNSLFFSPTPNDPNYHYEALQVVGGGIGYRFENVRFAQEGPFLPDLITGAIKFTGSDSVFDNSYFDYFGNGPGGFDTVNAEGRNLVMTNCRVERGRAAYLYPEVFSPPGGGGTNGYALPKLTGCTDFLTGAPI